MLTTFDILLTQWKVTSEQPCENYTSKGQSSIWQYKDSALKTKLTMSAKYSVLN